MTTHQLDEMGVDSGFGFGFGIALGKSNLKATRFRRERIAAAVFSIPVSFIDPQEQMIGIFMAQLHPGAGDIAERIRILSYQAIAD